MAGRLVRNISRHTSGDPAAMRVKSRKPLPASVIRRSESGAVATCHMKTDDKKWGTWLTEARAASCTSGYIDMTLAPQRSQIRRPEEHTTELKSLMSISYDVCCVKQKTHIY